MKKQMNKSMGQTKGKMKKGPLADHPAHCPQKGIGGQPIGKNPLSYDPAKGR